MKHFARNLIKRNWHVDDEIEVEGTPDKPVTVTLTNCSFRRLYVLHGIVTVRHCTAINPVGWTFVQLNGCQDSLVEWCSATYVPHAEALATGQGLAEDLINLYRSARCRVLSNWVEWHPAHRLDPANPLHAEYSGGGIMIDDGCQDCEVADNIVLNTQNYGCGIADGSGNRVRRNVIASAGPGVNGNVGAYVAQVEEYHGNPWGDNYAEANKIHWVRGDGTRADAWLPGQAVKVDYRAVRNVSLPKAPARAALRRLWMRRKAAMMR